MSSPASPTTSTNATVAFAITNAKTVKCSLDGAGFARCKSPVTYSGLALGGHAFVVRATHNGFIASATATWEVVTSPGPPPVFVMASAPVNGATGVADASNVTATFSADVDESTLTASTVNLQEGGSPVAARLSYSAATRTVALDPNASLQAGATYTATVVGGASGVKDASGNTLAATKTWTFTIAADSGGTTRLPERPGLDDRVQRVGTAREEHIER